MNEERQKIDLAELRGQLSRRSGPEYWRSLEELAGTEEFLQFVRSEFPAVAEAAHDEVSRRRFLQLMGASLALAGFTGCTRQPPEKIMPYVRAPEEVIPGKPLHFATTLSLGGIGTGVLVESHMGRPTKIEGNPQHPASLGAADARTQAAVLGLYDPDRAQVVTHRGSIRSWDTMVAALRAALADQEAGGGAGLRILTETVTSPTVADELRSILEKFPAATWHEYEPVNRDQIRAGALLAFGEDVDTHYRFDRADVIVSFDADFLGSFPGSVRYARDFAAKRRVALPATNARMSRLYVAETTPSITGAAADARVPLAPAMVQRVAVALGASLGVGPEQGPELPPALSRWVATAARELGASRGRGIVVAGDTQPPAVHALVHGLNVTLGNTGETVVHTRPIPARSVDQNESVRSLAADMTEGKVEVLLILGGNPVHTVPADLDFANALRKVPSTVHLSSSRDETSRVCRWHVPEAHPLESWGDCLAYDGTASLVQPLIAPLYSGKTAVELLGAVMGSPRPSSYEIVRAYWKRQRGEEGFEAFWRKALHDGVIAGSALPPKAVTLRPEFERGSPGLDGFPSPSGLEVTFRPDPAIWDGRFANNGWLQEMPRPLTKLTWDNVAAISPATAERLEVESGEIVELELGGRTKRAPVWVQPGHADESVTLTLGYGRIFGGKVASGVGFDANALRTSVSPRSRDGLVIHKTGERTTLATTQHHHSMEGRHLVRDATLEEYRQKPDFVHELGHDPPEDHTLFPRKEYKDHAWGMVIDLNACTGCSACTIACQAENNIPVVGKAEVAKGRSMHWIRVDRYYKGDLDDPETVHQPVPCMQCENAPCEIVCPVGATSHSSEGLNDMVYNRCVGTRYCANNCPYKVRRFNFYLYQDWETPSLALQRNPDVTVRSRGVMEKCTYCVQRINEARIEAKKEGRKIRDGEVVTACQATCPSQAIIFGDLNDPESRVSKAKADPRNYGILTELNTRPRTTYLARLTNPPATEEREG